ncbi:MAG: hypothetical protein ABFC84_13385 [Veillonellales bacterium]
MQSNFYIQKGSDAARDLFAEYGILVNSTLGLTDLPSTKELFSRDWSDKQGLDTYIPYKTIFKDKEVKITVSFLSDTGRSQFNAFLKYIICPAASQFTNEPRDGVFQFWSDYRKTGARLKYMSIEYVTERYRFNDNYIYAIITCQCVNGLSFGYAKTGAYSSTATFTIKSGESIDVYYSGGTKDLNKTETFTKANFSFCIVNPSSLDAVEITN